MKIVKGKVENLKLKEAKVPKSKMRRGDFFFLFFFLLCTFQKDEKNLFLVYQNENFLPGKQEKAFHARKKKKKKKKSGKMTLPPQKKIPVTPLEATV